MSKKLRWGVLSTAAIGLKKVLPAMQQGQYTTVDAIASRDLARAREAADALGIATAYGSYEELLADPDIDAIYNPLPNQLHVPWTIKAAEAGKHVLCEKPLSLTVAEAETLLAVRARTGVKIGEAFMIRCHPQWLRLRELLDEGRIGELRSITGFFSYFNDDPANIRNQIECGGGALHGYRLLLHSRVALRICAGACARGGQNRPRPPRCTPTGSPRRFWISRAASRSSPAARSSFLTSAYISSARGAHRDRNPLQRARPIAPHASSSTTAAICSAPASPRRPSRCATSTRCRATPSPRPFWRATEVPVPLEDAIRNMAVIEALFRSGETGQWEAPQK